LWYRRFGEAIAVFSPAKSMLRLLSVMMDVDMMTMVTTDIERVHIIQIACREKLHPGQIGVGFKYLQMVSSLI
jgi:hypothetical protein